MQHSLNTTRKIARNAEKDAEEIIDARKIREQVLEKVRARNPGWHRTGYCVAVQSSTGRRNLPGKHSTPLSILESIFPEIWSGNSRLHLE